MKFTSVYIISIFALILSCQSNTAQVQTEKSLDNAAIDSTQIKDQSMTKDSNYHNGKRTFVSSDYHRRAEGFDWVAVDIDSIAADTIAVNVYSRSDIKKPTCSFYSQAIEIEKGIYKAIDTKPIVMVTIDGEKLQLGSVPEENNQKLMYYCSGGANLVGDYQLLKEPMDSTQLK